MSAPSTFKQSSRKGKKSWRKNIDITDIESGLAKNKDLEITHGTADIGALDDAKLFQIDDTGDEDLKKKLIKRKQIKVVKSREILDSIVSNSKVQPLGRHKNQFNNSKDNKGKQVQGVSQKKLKKLLELSGKSLSTKDRLAATIEKDGILRTGSKSKDLWGEENDAPAVKQLTSPAPSYLSNITEEQKQKLSLPEELFTQSSSSWSTGTVQPKSMKMAPHKIKDVETIPHAGKSYNPDTKSWDHLFQKEYVLEQDKENRRVAIEQYKLKIQHLMDTLDDNEEEDSSDDEDAEEDVEHVKELSANPEDEGEKQEQRLSINPVVKNKKKTKYQRNKQRRHEEKVKLHQEIKTLKEQVKALEKLEEIEDSLKPVDHSHITTVGKDVNLKIQKKQKLGTKHTVMDDGLEIKFKEEITGSLRQLRPEGNLLYDNVRKLQSSGKIEARIPTRKGRRHKPRVTEKWTYKDFK